MQAAWWWEQGVIGSQVSLRITWERHKLPFCSKLPFWGCFYSKSPWKREVGSLSRANGRSVLSLGRWESVFWVGMFIFQYKRWKFPKFRVLSCASSLLSAASPGTPPSAPMDGRQRRGRIEGFQTQSFWLSSPSGSQVSPLLPVMVCDKTHWVSPAREAHLSPDMQSLVM